MTKINEEEDVAEVLMGRIRVKTIPLDVRSYEFINASLRRDSLLEDTAVGAVLYRKDFALVDGLRLSLELFNGSYKEASRPHLDIDIHKSVQYKPEEEVDMPLAWQTVTDKLPDELLFDGASLGIAEDYHIRFKAVKE